LLEPLLRQRLIVTGCFFGLLACMLWAFAPGLSGHLIFDDVPNFLPWQTLGDIDSLAKALTFTFSGTSFPGRPLSLLSFLIDDQNWSPDIYSLKRTNLAIHLLNACLVFWLCLKVFGFLRPDLGELRSSMLALFAAAIWALHPLQVSNVSYVIQRMNLLSTLFELIGLLVFLHGRAHLTGSPRRALLLCSVGIGLFMPLAILAKENGLLLCAFALLAERFCFTPVRLAWWRAWKFAFLWLPLLAFLFYCAFIQQLFTVGFGGRSFTAIERLLTQGPVVADYLDKLLLPRLQGSSLYYDNFPLSRSLLERDTLLAWTFITALLAAAWHLRQRLPIFSFGIFFYFTGHLMESTALPLELYFEHRNYLPQAGLWLAIASLLALAPARLSRVLAIAAVVLLAFLLTLTRQNAALWGQPALQAAVWYHDNPGSIRTSVDYANLLLQRGELDSLLRVLAEARKQHPDDLSLIVGQRYVRCFWQDLPTEFDDLPARVRKAPFETASITMLEQMRERSRDPVVMARLKNCRPATGRQLAAIYAAMTANPRFGSSNFLTRLHEFQAEIATEHGNLDATMHHYDEAFRLSRNPIYPYRQALILLDAGLPEEARRFAALSETSYVGRFRLTYTEMEGRLRELKARLPETGKSPDGR
jgi:hypothetical protein